MNRKTITTSLWITAFSVFWANSAVAQDANFHIYLAFGQSNMEGVGAIEEVDRVTDPRVKVLQDFTCPNLSREYGQWYTAEPPLFGCWGNLSVADYFAKTMANGMPEEVTIGIVPTAIGGSDIALFQKSAPIGKGTAGPEKVPAQFAGGYAWLLDLAQKAQQQGVIKGIIFHQGETNTADPEWKYKVQEIVTDLRTDLDLGEVPFLSGELLYQNLGGCCGVHNSEIAQLPNIISNAHVVSADGLAGADVAHFTSASYREFGRRYAKIMLPLVGGKIPVDNGCGEKEGQPICCNANADPDGEGTEDGAPCLVEGAEPEAETETPDTTKTPPVTTPPVTTPTDTSSNSSGGGSLHWLLISLLLGSGLTRLFKSNVRKITMFKLSILKSLLTTVLMTLLVVSAQVSAKKFDDIALTPPMGWNSWNTFACDINEKMIKEMADIMAKSGMKEAGYEYINIDDCWHGERDENGNIQVNKERFPSGMKALADYVHSKGLKLGLYSDAGWKTCGGKPGSRGYEFQDAKQYAKWGIDYLKYDWCNTEGLKAEGAYLTMRDALFAAGRPIVFSVCEWGDNQPWEWASDIGHLWRTSGDIINCWDCEHKHLVGTPNEWSSWGILKILDMRHNIRQYAGPGHWNDMDMMEVGNGLSTLEDQSHFTMWAMLASPLIAGNDLRIMSKETLATLTNKDVVAINQDILGIQGFKYQAKNGVDVWLKPLANARWAMAVLNRNDQAVDFDFDFVAQGVIVDELSGKKIDLKNTRHQIKDVWHNKMLGDTSKSLNKKIQGHETLTLILAM